MYNIKIQFAVHLGEASKISIPAGCRLTYWRIEAAITAEAWLGQLFFTY